MQKTMFMTLATTGKFTLSFFESLPLDFVGDFLILI